MAVRKFYKKYDLDDLRDKCHFEGTIEDSDAIDFITKMLKTDSATELIGMSKSALKKAKKQDIWKDVAWLFLLNENTPDSVLSELVKIAPDIQAQIWSGEDFEYVILISHPNNSPSSLSCIAKEFVKQIGCQSLPLTALFASKKLDSQDLTLLCKTSGVEKNIDAFLVLNHPNSNDDCKESASWFEGTVADIDSGELDEHDFLLTYGFDIPAELKKHLKRKQA